MICGFVLSPLFLGVHSNLQLAIVWIVIYFMMEQASKGQIVNNLVFEVEVVVEVPKMGK